MGVSLRWAIYPPNPKCYTCGAGRTKRVKLHHYRLAGRLLDRTWRLGNLLIAILYRASSSLSLRFLEPLLEIGNLALQSLRETIAELGEVLFNAGHFGEPAINVHA